MDACANEKAIKQQILEELNRHPFSPAWWLRGRHAQTIWGQTARKKLGHIGAPKLRHERWDTPDGDFLDLLFLDGPANAPLVVLFHGMEGSPASYYIPGYARQFKRLGWSFCVMFFRSCGLEMNRTAKLYSLSSTEDPEFVLHRFREQYPHRTLYAIGISLGGNVLAKWLGEQGEAARSYVDGAVVVSAPYDPVATAPRFHKELRGMYVRHFVSTLKVKALDVARRHPGLLDEEEIRKAHDFYTFDDAVTSKLFGFKNAVDYWGKSACGQFLPGIRVPTLLITSEDDQFVLPECVPHAVCEESPYLYPQFTQAGGHVGFVYGPLPCCARYWYEEQTLRFFEALSRLRKQ